ncbi:MAG: hypothetical protein MN733_24895 [Nitrososphaera sp.]|nr:hypothetical protein [Nitrososphaera sp.]
MKTSISKIFADLTPDKFLTGKAAVDRCGWTEHPHSSRAVKWCTIGWLAHTFRSGMGAHVVRERIKEKLHIGHISKENDERGYKFIEQLQSMTEEFEL